MTDPLVHYVADVAVIAAVDAHRPTHVLLIRRACPPFAGAWALPGGYVERTETSAEAAVRELREETGLDVQRHSLAGVDPVGVYDEPGRDPRGRVVSIAYVAVVDRLWPVTGGDDAQAADWAPLRESDPADPWAWHSGVLITDGRVLAFDHDRILRGALDLAQRHIVV